MSEYNYADGGMRCEVGDECWLGYVPVRVTKLYDADDGTPFADVEVLAPWDCGDIGMSARVSDLTCELDDDWARVLSDCDDWARTDREMDFLANIVQRCQQIAEA